MRGGAIDYLTKPVDLRRLQKIVTKAVRAIELRSSVASLRGELYASAPGRNFDPVSRLQDQ